MDSEYDVERLKNNESRDILGSRLPCFQCGEDDVEILVMRYNRYSDRHVPGLLHRECEWWLEWDCPHCDMYRGMVIQ